MSSSEISDKIESLYKELCSRKIETDLKLVSVRGTPQNPTFDVKTFEDIIDNFRARDSDVFVATYVKAGTTWTQQIITQILRQGEVGGKYGESVPWLEAAASEFLLSREAPTWTYAKMNEWQGARFFKTHATVSDLPGRGGQAKPKVIYVARNPKDSMVSLYHHAKSKPEFEYTGDFNTFFNIFITGQSENGSWFDHVIDWYRECEANPATHLFLKYEDMCDDPLGSCRAIAAFIGVPVSDDVLANVVKNSSIAEMKVTQSIGLNHLRQGGYGNWRAMFTVQLSETFDEVYRLKMKACPELTFNFGAALSGQPVVL